MPDILTTSLVSDPNASAPAIAWRIGAALIVGVAVAGLYRWARRGEAVRPTFLTTLILLAPLIAMATQVIGDNVARAFSLVGALSVVRFRTVVKDTQDTAFVIFSVVVGMAAGAGHLEVGLIGLIVVGVAAMALWPPGKLPESAGAWRTEAGTLTIRVGLADGIRTAAESLLAASTESFELISAATARQGSAYSLTYRVRLRAGTSPAGLVAELNALDGVETVELSRGE